jgi:anti-sigma B factor antagonist
MRVSCGADSNLEQGLLVVPSGNLDADGSSVLVEAILDRLTPKTPALLIDMSEVPYMSSAGISALIRLLARARQLGGAVSLFGCRSAVRKVLKLVGIESVLNVRESEEAARERLTGLGIS